jgi:sarcosine reductase
VKRKQLSDRALTLEYEVTDVRAGSPTRFVGGVLTVDSEEIKHLAGAGQHVGACRVTLVKPGDPVRMIHVLDAVRPICSTKGRGQGAFPGLLSPPSTIGAGGDMIDLNGVLVTTVGCIPPVDSFLKQQEGILDMTGPGAALSPLAEQSHVVLELESNPGAPSSEVAMSFRRVAAATAELLASTAIAGVPDSVRPGRGAEASPHALRLAHICEVSAFGSMFDTLVGGRSVIGSLPTPVSLSALDSGVVVSADYHYAGQRNLTCHYQRNPIAEAISKLFGQHEVVHTTTILLPVGRSDEEKEAGAAYAAHLAGTYGADGAIVTAVAGGNAHLDVMFTVRACERRGIRAALSLVEMAGPGGTDPGMVDTVPEADLLVSTGNREQLVDLPKFDRVLGGSHLFEGPVEEGAGAQALGVLRVPMRTLIGVNNEMGAWTVGATAS